MTVIAVLSSNNIVRCFTGIQMPIDHSQKTTILRKHPTKGLFLSNHHESHLARSFIGPNVNWALRGGSDGPEKKSGAKRDPGLRGK